MAVLFVLGARPFAAGLIPAWWDKLAHLAVFAALTALLWVGTAGRTPLVVIAAVITIGALDELHQGSLPGRHADVMDFLTDACAAAGTGALMYWLDAPRRTGCKPLHRRPRSSPPVAGKDRPVRH